VALPLPPELPESIFGALSTEEGRVRQARRDRVGLGHAVQRSVIAPEAGEAVVIRARVGVDLALVAVELRYSTDPDLDPASDAASPLAPSRPHPGVVAVPMQRTRLEWDTLAWGYLEDWSAPIPGQEAGTVVFYAIRATTLTGTTLWCPWEEAQGLAQLPGPGPNTPLTYAYGVGRRPIPQWIREAVIYQVFVDRFAPDPGQVFAEPEDLAGCFGGTLRGVISRLDDLQALGVSCLWLTPIFPSPVTPRPSR